MLKRVAVVQVTKVKKEDMVLEKEEKLLRAKIEETEIMEECKEEKEGEIKEREEINKALHHVQIVVTIEETEKIKETEKIEEIEETEKIKKIEETEKIEEIEEIEKIEEIKEKIKIHVLKIEEEISQEDMVYLAHIID